MNQFTLKIIVLIAIVFNITPASFAGETNHILTGKDIYYLSEVNVQSDVSTNANESLAEVLLQSSAKKERKLRKITGAMLLGLGPLIIIAEASSDDSSTFAYAICAEH